MFLLNNTKKLLAAPVFSSPVSAYRLLNATFGIIYLGLAALDVYPQLRWPAKAWLLLLASLLLFVSLLPRSLDTTFNRVLFATSLLTIQAIPILLVAADAQQWRNMDATLLPPSLQAVVLSGIIVALWNIVRCIRLPWNAAKTYAEAQGECETEGLLTSTEAVSSTSTGMTPYPDYIYSHGIVGEDIHVDIRPEGPPRW